MQYKSLAATLTGLLALAFTGTAAKADYAYGFASQTISNVSLTPATGTLTPGSVITSTQDGYTLNGTGTSASNATDAPQQGIGALPPENTFTRTITGNPPSGTGPMLIRGDVLISGLGGTNPTGSGVSEGYLTSSGFATSFSSLTASFVFTPTATGTINIGYTYGNDIYTATSGSGMVTASYNFGFAIKNNATGFVVFDYGSSPLSANTNATLSSPPPSGELIRSGSDVVTSSSLSAGTSYSLIFTNKTAVSVAVGVVPEPSSFALLGIAVVMVGGMASFRRVRCQGADEVASQE